MPPKRPPVNGIRASPPADAPTPEARIGKLGATLLARVAGIAIGRAYVYFGAIWIGVGGLVLTVGWQAGPQKLVEARQFGTLTARTPGHIVESWLAVELVEHVGP